MTDDYTDLTVCTRHFRLVGIYEGKHHRCPCVPVDDGWQEREWGGHDIAGVVDLCHLCVRQVIPTTSRWSWFGCEDCRQVNQRIAEAISEDPRSQILPLGRHSMMNPHVLHNEDPGDTGDEDEVVPAIVYSMMSLHKGWQRLHDWKTQEGRRRAIGSGLVEAGNVPLRDWLSANPGSLGASVDAICRYVDDDLPDLPGMDVLQAARDRLWRRAHDDRHTAL